MALCRFQPHGNSKYGSDGIIHMKAHEFKKWLKKFDADNDGMISQEELRQAARAMGCWFTKMKAKAGLKSADKNDNGHIDDDEIINLKDFVLKHFGINIIIDKN
ncbi:OLC1v1016734C1 [Oldenlandia corymbosa var. corymbosa]|uniref:OLC1v1016734C1 n=1 Tax=Oldenlandia corymbosa var. corymbosa TaxID=529605 RepID=A0AAV1E7S8_OLDCO|nr:OLC1v1016734C1 [Oldenlandia corymbosa var. corymbosa]